jgi:hypothetical protein
MYLGVNTQKDLIVNMPISKLTCNDEEIHNPSHLPQNEWPGGLRGKFILV